MWFIKVILLGAPRLGEDNSTSSPDRRNSKISAPLEKQSSRAQELWSQHPVSSSEISPENTALVTPTEWAATKDLTDEARMLIQFFYSYYSSPEESLLEVQSSKTRRKFEQFVDEISGRSKAKVLLGLSKKLRKTIRSPKQRETINGRVHTQNWLQSLTSRDSFSNSHSHQHTPTSRYGRSGRVVPQCCWSQVLEGYPAPVQGFCILENGRYRRSARVHGHATSTHHWSCPLPPVLQANVDDLKSRYTVSYLSPSRESTTSEESTLHHGRSPSHSSS